MVNMSSKFDKEICNGVDSIAFTRSTYVRGSVTTGQTDTRTHRQTPDKVIPMCRCSQASIDVHCDLDLWPLTSIINRVHPLIMVNMSSKFDKEIWNGVDSIAFTRSTYVRGSVTTGQTDTRTHRQTPDKVIPMCRYASQATQQNKMLGVDRKSLGRSDDRGFKTVKTIFRRRLRTLNLNPTPGGALDPLGAYMVPRPLAILVIITPPNSCSQEQVTVVASLPTNPSRDVMLKITIGTSSSYLSNHTDIAIISFHQLP